MTIRNRRTRQDVARVVRQSILKAIRELPEKNHVTLDELIRENLVADFNATLSALGKYIPKESLKEIHDRKELTIGFTPESVDRIGGWLMDASKQAMEHKDRSTLPPPIRMLPKVDEK